jgi:predicted DNA-binding transcriptional regulator AlpA
MKDRKILRPKEVAQMLGVSIVTLNRYALRPDFPRKIKLSPRHTGYYQDELITYLDTFTRHSEVVNGKD